MGKNIFTLVILLLSYCTIYGQINTGEEPVSFRTNFPGLNKRNRIAKTLPRFDIEKIKREDREDDG